MTESRRLYWAEQMDAAVALVRAAADHPLAESGERCGRLDEAAREAGVELAFSDRPHANGGPRIWLLRQSLIGSVLDPKTKRWILRMRRLGSRAA